MDDGLPPHVVAQLALIRAAIPNNADEALLAALNDIERIVLRDAAHSQAQSEKAKRSAEARKARNELRNVAMAEEFLKRRRNPWNDYGDTEIAAFVGKLPRFNLRKSAAIEAIKVGLNHHSLAGKFGQPGKADSSCGITPSPPRAAT